MTEQELIQLVADALRYASGVAVGRAVDGKIIEPANVRYTRDEKTEEVVFLINGRQVRMPMSVIRDTSGKPAKLLELAKAAYESVLIAERDRAFERMERDRNKEVMRKAQLEAAKRLDDDKAEQLRTLPPLMDSTLKNAYQDLIREAVNSPGITVRNVTDVEWGLADSAFRDRVRSMNEQAARRAEEERRQLRELQRAQQEQRRRSPDPFASNYNNLTRSKTPAFAAKPKPAPKAEPIAARPEIEDDGKRKFFLD